MEKNLDGYREGAVEDLTQMVADEMKGEDVSSEKVEDEVLDMVADCEAQDMSTQDIIFTLVDLIHPNNPAKQRDLLMQFRSTVKLRPHAEDLRDS